MNFLNYIPLTCDIILAVIFVISIVRAAKRGLIKSIYRIVSVIITLLLVGVLIQPVTNVLEESQVGAVIYRTVNDKINTQTDKMLSEGKTGIDTDSVWDMPEYIKNVPELQNAAENMAATTTHVITNVIIKIIAAVCLYTVIRLMLSLLFVLLEGFFKLPVLRSINALAGIAAGIINTAAIVYVVCAVISLDLPIFAGMKDIVAQTYIIKYFYNYNLLMNLFI